MCQLPKAAGLHVGQHNEREAGSGRQGRPALLPPLLDTDILYTQRDTQTQDGDISCILRGSVYSQLFYYDVDILTHTQDSGSEPRYLDIHVMCETRSHVSVSAAEIWTLRLTSLERLD